MKNKTLQTLLLSILLFTASSFILTPGTMENCNTRIVAGNCGTSASYGFPFTVFSAEFSQKTFDYPGIFVDFVLWLVVSAILVLIINYLVNLKKSE